MTKKKDQVEKFIVRRKGIIPLCSVPQSASISPHRERHREIESIGAGPCIEGHGRREPGSDETVLAIVKVSEPDYVPRCARLRSRIDRHLITVECRYDAISMLEADPRFDSVALQQPMRMID